MRTIGFRVEPSQVTFAIYDLDQQSIINIEHLILPKSLDIPEQLKFIRLSILDIMREFNVIKAGIKITESNAQRTNINRVQIEGVIQEAFASSNIESYFIGQISSITSKLGFERVNFKRYIKNELIYNVENWETLKPVEKEAIFVAIGASV